MSRRRPERLAFFVFDLLQLDGFDLNELSRFRRFQGKRSLKGAKVT
jgi:ATP-dependent DNA ligase